jgi:hypothetical protein
LSLLKNDTFILVQKNLTDLNTLALINVAENFSINVPQFRILPHIVYQYFLTVLAEPASKIPPVLTKKATFVLDILLHVRSVADLIVKTVRFYTAHFCV